MSLVCSTIPPYSYPIMLPNSPLQHDQNATQFMRNGQIYNVAPQFPCIQKPPLKLKKP